MAHNRAKSAARNASLVWLIISGLILAGGLAFAAFAVLPKYMAFFNEPTVIDIDDLEDLDNLPIYNAQITGKEMFDTSYYYEDSYLFIPLSREYFGAMWTGDKFLLVRNGGVIDESALTYKGTLRELDRDESTEVVMDLEREVPETQGFFMSVVLDATDHPTEFGNLVMVVVALAAIGFGLYGVYRGFSHLTNPAKHPFLKSLSRYGDPDDVVDRIEKERVLQEDKVGKLTLTKNWIIDEKGNNFRVMRAQDLLWVYKHVQTGRYNTKHYSLRLYDQHGEMISVGAKNEKQADEMGMEIAKHAPWALIGYDKKIEDAWKNQRNQLIAAVEQRKVQASA
ncbi:hypothetical protein G4Y79_21380 [Phototrophicus methaneseepsis]|uniref:Uncharacterized protein n=1 Tax=Phototrophicus methaneseepsis TaxID=2710758 RepID=A0A7S8E893_9CHLR|nr:DUF6709 family protein [Phototrophicus methaneseepsis]QPC82210.1 hypothetical protein G4Y79_21380 [Phototrophicus methaneseepsis]